MISNSSPTTTRRSFSRRNYALVAVAFLVLVGALAYFQVMPPSQKTSDCALAETGRVSLPNIPNRLDHMAFSADSKLLVITARNNNSLAVVNTGSMKLDKVVHGFDLPNAVAFVNQGRALVVTNGGNGTVSVVDPGTFAGVATVDLHSNADNLAVDPTASKLYVGYGVGGVAFIDTTSWKLIQSSPLIGHPEALRLEANGSRLFVNVPAGDYVAVLDKNSGQTLGNWPITNATGVFPMALDEAHHVLFVGSRAPAKLIMINTFSGAEVAELGVPGDVDDLFYDPGSGCVLVSSGAGYITEIKEVTPSSLTFAQSIQTYPGARTSLLDVKSGTYFLAVPQSQNASAMVIAYSVGR